MITATQAAIDKLKSLKEGDKALRVSVIGGGCSGLSYKLGWIDADSIAPNDRLITIDEIKIAIDPKSHLYIAGMELDHTDGLDGQGFQFNNPMAKRSCGCGNSFSV